MDGDDGQGDGEGADEGEEDHGEGDREDQVELVLPSLDVHQLDLVVSIVLDREEGLGSYYHHDHGVHVQDDHQDCYLREERLMERALLPSLDWLYL